MKKYRYLWVRSRLCKLQKRCTPLATASDKVYKLLAHGRWFFPDTPASSTTKTGRHDIAESGIKTPTIKIKNQILASPQMDNTLLQNEKINKHEQYKSAVNA